MQLLSDSSASIPQNDPICNLSPHSKMRLCASLYSAKGFERRLYRNHLEATRWANCVEKEVMIGRLTRLFMSEGRVFKEWMLPCRANEFWFLDEIDYEVDYYVSQGMFGAVNTVFVYANRDMRKSIKLAEGPVNVHILASNMSVVNLTYLDKFWTNLDLEDP